MLIIKNLNQKIISFLIFLLLITKSTIASGNYSAWKKINSYATLKIDSALMKETKTQIKWHQQHPNSIIDMSENARLYLPYILQEAIDQKLPSELALIPFVESNYDPFAKSHKGAAGLWQIMPDLASASSLEINSNIDERREVIKSTKAAMKQLKYLHGRLHNRWDYAIAAYSAGEGRVRQAIKQSQRSGYKTSWTTFLPEETRKYLPKIYALKSIIKNPKKYQIELPELSSEHHFSAHSITRKYSFNQLSETCKIDSDMLHRLNPAWKSVFIESNNMLVIPKNTAFSCTKKLRKTALFDNKWAYHKVTKSETISQIASLYKTSVDSIMKYNGLSNHKVQTASRLIIKKNETSIPKVSLNKTLNMAITAEGSQGPTQIRHQVKPKETIQAISRQLQVKVAHIAYWNQLKYPYALQEKQSLIIWKDTVTKTGHTKYVVQTGDTFSAIAKKHKISQKKLISANKIDNINRLKLNQVITIPQ